MERQAEDSAPTRAGPSAVSKESWGEPASEHDEIPRSWPIFERSASLNPNSPPDPSNDLLSSALLVAPFRHFRSEAEGMDDSRVVSRAQSPVDEENSAQPGLHLVFPTTNRSPFEVFDQPGRNSSVTSAILQSALNSTARPEKNLVELGLISEDEAKVLFSSYTLHCSDFILVQDVRIDFWEKIRAGSPLLSASILAVGAMARDRTGPVSDAGRITTQAVKALIMSSIFQRKV